MTANGYALNLLTKKHRKTDNHIAQEKPTETAIIPYAPGISEKLRRIGSKSASEQLSDQVLHYAAYLQRLGLQTKHKNQRTASTTSHANVEKIHRRDMQTITNESK